MINSSSSITAMRESLIQSILDKMDLQGRSNDLATKIYCCLLHVWLHDKAQQEGIFERISQLEALYKNHPSELEVHVRALLIQFLRRHVL
jgi:hypothetical protein